MAEISFESHAQAERFMASKMKKMLGVNRKPRPNMPDNPSAAIYIYNISDQEFVWTQAGFPRFVVPACPEGKEYSEPLRLCGDVGNGNKTGCGLYLEEYLDVDKTSHNLYNTAEIAAEILQFGPGKSATLDRRNLGLFLSQTNPPTEQEIAAAKGMLTRRCEMLLREGDKFFAANKLGEINEEHLRAARYLRQNRDWAKPRQKMIDCPGCGQAVAEGIAVHLPWSSCGAILDKKRAFEMYPWLKEQGPHGNRKPVETAA